MLNEVPFNEVWFVVSPQNPHKKKEQLADEYHRLEMVNLAIGEFDKFKAVDIEFTMPKPSYTIDTLVRLSEKYSRNSFSLIMGSDNLQSFKKWKNYDIILQNYRIVVYPRKEFPFIYFENCLFVEAPQIELSSTFLRNQIKQNKPINFFVPEKVNQYIESCRLYK